MSQFSYSNLSLTSSHHCILLTSSSVLQTPSNLSGQVDSQAVSKLHLLRSSKSGLPSSSVSSHSTRDLACGTILYDYLDIQENNYFCLQSWKLSIAVWHSAEALGAEAFLSSICLVINNYKVKRLNSFNQPEWRTFLIIPVRIDLLYTIHIV